MKSGKYTVPYLLILFISCQAQENKNIGVGKNILNTSIEYPTVLKYPIRALLCDGFDFPVGNADGKGPYISLLDGKKYDSWAVSVPFGIKYSLGIHPGDDWGGTGPSDSDLGQPVYSIAKGVVVYAEDYEPPWGNIVMIRHIFRKNSDIDTVFSVYIHLKELYVKTNQLVQRRDSIGTVGDGGVYRPHLHFEIRKNTMKDNGANYWPSSDDKDLAWVLKNYESPSKFIAKNRTLLK